MAPNGRCRQAANCAEEDEQKIFGPNYPGSSDDPVEDMRGIFEAFAILHLN